MAETHYIGQVWYLEGDERYSIHLTWCGYSVPLYCCYFCGGKMLAACRTLDRAMHACAVLKAEREADLPAPVVTKC